MLNRTHLMSFATLAVLIALPGISKAENDEGDSLHPVSFPAIDSGNVSCKEAKQAEWFQRQLGITDGDPSPYVSPVKCQREAEILASTGGDAE